MSDFFMVQKVFDLIDSLLSGVLRLSHAFHNTRCPASEVVCKFVLKKKNTRQEDFDKSPHGEASSLWWQPSGERKEKRNHPE